MADITAIVPVRSFSTGKSRLRPVLSEAVRRRLIRVMFEDVIDALAGTPVADIVVACADPAVARFALRQGCAVLPDAAGVESLSDVVRAARSASGGSSTLVVAGDLPCLSPPDVEELLVTEGDVVIAPSADAGTNGILLRTARAFPFAYGRHSAYVHAASAAIRGDSWSYVRRDGWRMDVDTPTDLRQLRAWPLARHTASFLAELHGAPGCTQPDGP